MRRGLCVRAALALVRRFKAAKAARTHRPRRTPNMPSLGLRSSSLLCVNTNARLGNYRNSHIVSDNRFVIARLSVESGAVKMNRSYLLLDRVEVLGVGNKHQIPLQLCYRARLIAY